jgi:hypothetical protein
MLEALIPSKTRVKLLTLFLLNPESAFFIREISRMTEENVNYPHLTEGLATGV